MINKIKLKHLKYIFFTPHLIFFYFYNKIKNIKFFDYPSNFGMSLHYFDYIYNLKKKKIFLVSRNRNPNTFLEKLFISKLNLKKNYLVLVYELICFFNLNSLLLKLPGEVKITDITIKKKSYFVKNKFSLINYDNFIKNFNLENKKWIVIHNRDEVYLKKVYQNINWDYHAHRDSKIKTFYSAIKYFLKNGYSVVRVGKYAKEKASIKKVNGNVFIDYPFVSHKKDVYDIYFLNHCKLYFGSDSGVNVLPMNCNIPIAQNNFSPTQIDQLFIGNRFPSIIKKIFCLKKKNYLSLKEMFEKKLHRIVKNDDLLNLGYSLEDNSELEILNQAKECLNVLNKLESYESYVKKNKDYYDELAKICKFYIINNQPDLKNIKFKFFLSPYFLEKNKFLLR